MSAWLEAGLSNAVVATALALVACAVTRYCRRPQWALAAWMLVLGKLLMPPLVGVHVDCLQTLAPAPIAFEQKISEVLASDDAPELDAELLVSPSIAPQVGEPPAVEPESPLEFAPPIVAEFAAPGEVDMAMLGRAIDPPVSERIATAAAHAAPWLFWMWLAGSVTWAVVAAVRVARFVRVLGRAGLAPTELQDEVRALAGRLGLRRVPVVRLVGGCVPPCVWAMTGNATMLLPGDLLEVLSERQRATLLVHELVHLARRDHWLRWVELAALAVYWWHPVAWWARRNVEQAQELCCDARVVGVLPQSARAYAETLLATVEFLADSRSTLPLGASGFSHVHQLTRRMEMILANSVVRRGSWLTRLALAAIGLAVLPLSLHVLRAEPSSEKQEQQQAEEEVVARASEAEVVEEAVTAKSANTASSAIEQRLDRLEKLIQALAEQKKGQPATFEKPAEAPRPAPKSPPAKSREAAKKWRDVDQAEERLGLQHLAQDEDLKAQHELTDLVRTSTVNLELVKTNSHRYQAHVKQLKDVKRGYDDGTVTIDQLLEAQLRAAEMESSYYRNVCDLCGDPVRAKYLFARANLGVGDRALKEAREIWQKIHAKTTPGSGDDKAEAQAREQYFQFKAQNETLLNEYLRTKEMMDALGVKGKATSQKQPTAVEAQTRQLMGFPFFVGTDELSPAALVTYKKQSHHDRLLKARAKAAKFEAERENADREHETQGKRMEAEFEQRAIILNDELERLEAEEAETKVETRY